MALGAPERLDSLVLMDTDHGPVHGLDPGLVAAAISVVRTEGIDAFADMLGDLESPLVTPAHNRLLAERPGYAEFGDRKLRATSPALYAAIASAFIETADRLDDLKTLPPSLPALVIVGEQDRPFLRPSKRMASAIPSGALVVIPEAGHS